MNIGIVSATGLVGIELCKILVKHGYTNLFLCASDKNINTSVSYLNSKEQICEYTLLQLNNDFFNNLNIVFFCSNNDISKKWIPIALEKEIYIIDNSSEFRLHPKIPLIIPEINGHLLLPNIKLIANPNCSTAILCMVLYPLLQLGNIIRIDITTYQAVSGAGKAGIEELENQTKQFIDKIPLTCNVFKSPIIGNCFSHNSPIDLENGYNEEEIKIIKETQKILQINTEISATCVRVPVFRTHTENVKIVFENPIQEIDIRNVLSSFNGIKIIDDRETNTFPEPAIASNTNDIYVGRIRQDYYDKSNKIYHMLICGDQLLKGASWNAFQIFLIIKNFHN